MTSMSFWMWRATVASEDLPAAIQRFNDLEPYRLRWIEQPLPSHDLAAHAKLRGAVTTPIGTGEDEWNPESYKRLIESGGVDVVQLDPGRCLGITGCRQVLKMIEVANLDASAHTWSSALNTAASLHMLANSPNHVGMDLKPHPSPMQHELVTDPWVQVDGYVHLRGHAGSGSYRGRGGSDQVCLEVATRHHGVIHAAFL